MAVNHDSTNSRFVFRDDSGEIAGEVTYLDDSGVLVLVKAEIWPERQGQGLGMQLVRETLELIRSNGLGPIRPTCPYIVKYLMKNPGYQDLLA